MVEHVKTFEDFEVQRSSSRAGRHLVSLNEDLRVIVYDC